MQSISNAKIGQAPPRAGFKSPQCTFSNTHIDFQSLL